MAPNINSRDSDIVTGAVEEKQEVKRDPIFARFDKPFGLEQHQFNLCYLVPAHLLAGYFGYLTWSKQAPSSVVLWELLWGYLGGLGTTVGCHRFWSHKTFKANLPLQYLLMIMQTISFQYPIHKWSLDHRIHHRYTDTDADPHNSKRGFWYCHIGWLLEPRTKAFLHKAKRFDMPDLESDPVVRFQSKYYWTLHAIFHYIVPIAITYYFWEMPLFYCVCSNFRRHIVSLHITYTVNSFAHMVGDRPYDKNITPTQNALVSLFAVGEGWHNYHHTFPWDYKASEFGGWKINASSLFIDFFASIGWAYDLKTVSQKMLKQRLQRTGDGSHANAKDELHADSENDFDYSTPNDVTELMKTIEKPIWGWDDASIPDDFRQVTRILRPAGRL